MNNGGRKKVWILLFWIALFFIAVIAASCKSVEYVPVPEYHTEIVHHRDTVIQKDSILKEVNTILREARPEDSAMIAQLGIKLGNNERLLILLQNALTEKNNSTYESHNSDSVRVDSVRVPYPVEKKLSRWQTFCCDYGKVMLGATLLLIVALTILIIRWIKHKNK
jgi:hypothetical protein